MDTERTKKSSWWDRRTRIEKVLLVLIAFAIVVVIYLASNLLMTRRPTSHEALQKNVCLSEMCIRSAAKILEKIDNKVDPCTDFYKFACGNFIKNVIIPDDKTQISSFSHVGDKTDLQLMKIFEEPIKDDDAKFVKLTKSIYKSCMNTSQIEKEGLGYIKQLFKELGGWPLMEHGSWFEKNFDWRNTLYRLQRLGWRRTMFLALYVGTDLKNSTRSILTITQPCMPVDRLKKGFNDTAVQALYKYLVDIATSFGADHVSAATQMREVVDFEIALAKIAIPYEQRKNATLQYNPISIRDLQKKYTSIPWLQYINSYLSPIDMLRSDDIVNLSLPKFVEQLEDFMLNTPKRILANYMFSRLLRDSVDYLPEEFKKKETDYYKTVYGQRQATPRWKECVWHADRLHIAVSAIYARKLVDKSIKTKVTELTSDIKSSFLETLRKIGWMDRKTKKHAILKAEKMGSFIAYPEELFDDDKVEGYYEGLDLDPEAYFLKISFNYSQFAHMKNIKELREIQIKPDWKSQAYINYVNAFYDQNTNSIELPAAILQDNFFDSNRPQYMNYGAIGEIIGHEITHGFDDSGRQYDKDGNLIDWWDSETNRTFARKSQCLVDQYSNYTVPDIEMNVNGEKTLGENIADNGGIKIAYRGYLKWLERNKEELMLPGLPYTGKQLFWISAATNWCTKYKKEALKQMVTLGVHAPTYFRIVIPFMNSDYFGKDFNCPLGSPMNPKYKCRVW